MPTEVDRGQNPDSLVDVINELPLISDDLSSANNYAVKHAHCCNLKFLIFTLSKIYSNFRCNNYCSLLMIRAVLEDNED